MFKVSFESECARGGEVGREGGREGGRQRERREEGRRLHRVP